MIRTRALVLLLLVVPLGTRSARGDEDDPVTPLLEGVHQIAVPGVPGPLCLVSPSAFALVTAGEGQEPVVGAAEWGKGRVVAFGHGGYFGKRTLETADTLRLMQNAAAWAQADHKGDLLVIRAPALADALAKDGRTVRRANRLDPERDLTGVAVLCADAERMQSAAAQRAVRRFVRRGGGLITASLGWGWKQLHPGADLATAHPGNRLLAEAGVLWADGTLAGKAGRYAVDAEHLQLANAATALDRLETQTPGQAPAKRDAPGLRQAAAVLARAAATLAPGDRLLTPRLAKHLHKRAGKIVPRADAPLGLAHALDRVLLRLEVRRLATLPASDVRAHPAADVFPGAVSRTTAVTKRTIEIDTSRPGQPREGIYAAAGKPTWHGTGLYAPPGRRIQVQFDARLLGKGAGVRIGSHTDRLWQKSTWSRVPEISRWFPAEKKRVTAANAFGGLVYITVPGAVRVGRVTVQVDGAVAAPRFVLGTTTPAAWRKTLRGAPGPWAELESDKVILTLPSAQVREMDDPTAALELWGRIMDACADLAARPRARRAPERICADVQISNGYMHSGYPVMAHLDAAAWMADPARLRKGSWGLFHEIGHNHQSRDWTFDGTTEVTVNLFSLYILDTVCGIPPDQGRSNVPVARAKLEAYLASGPDFKRWKRDPWLALSMYWQLQRGFGWQPFIDIFAAYRALSAAERPKDDAARRDQFLERFSLRVKKNLGPFFQAWGIPTSDAVRARIEPLPGWMPPDFPKH